MRIILTGGGTGGHFYPIIAVAEALKDVASEKKFVELDLIFMSDSAYNEKLLKQEGIRFEKILSGKMRRYFSFYNIIDVFKIAVGAIQALFRVYKEFPDVIFGKGGYASFPSLLAARILRIPVLIHESDARPGQVNKWAGKFAKKVAISFPEAAEYFSKDKTALTGVPIRSSILGQVPEEGREIFQLEPALPVILVLGGSQGAKAINETMLSAAKDLLGFCQVIHQSGRNNFKDVSARLSVVLEDAEFKSRYHLVDFLNSAQLRAASSAADLVVSRAGAGAIFEIAAWGRPSILIPLENSAQGHQQKNALSYASRGAAEIIEEPNLTPHIMVFEIKRLLANPQELEKMKTSAENFARPQAARKIAEEIINLGLHHDFQKTN